MRSTRAVPVLALALLAAAAVGSGAAHQPVAAAVESPAAERATANESPLATRVTANEPPLAEAGLDRRVTQGAAVVLDGTGSRDPDGEIAAYRWTITTPNGSTVTPDCPDCPRTAFTAAEPGEYEVTLTVTDDDGATATDTLYVTVERATPPAVTVSGPGSVTSGSTRTYTVAVTAGDLSVARVVWTVDGRVVANRSASDPGATTLQVSFTDPGRHTVAASAVDAVGQAARDSLGVRVDDSDADDDGGGGNDGGSGDATTRPPEATIDANRTAVDAGGAVRLSGARSSDRDSRGAGAAIETYRWDLDGDGRFDDARGETVVRRFDASTTVRLVVVDNEGERSEPAAVTIATRKPGSTPPEAAFSLDRTTVCVGSSVTADPGASRDTDLDNGGPKDEAIETTVWRVDGTLSHLNAGEPIQSIAFTSEGIHRLTLQVIDNDGQRDSVTREVTVLGPGEGDCRTDEPPVADIEYNDDDGVVGSDARLVFDGTGSFDADNPARDGSQVVSYRWSVDGERVGTGPTVSYVFSSPGDHTVSLRVTDDEGSTDTAQTTITVRGGNNDATTGQAKYSDIEIVGPVRVTDRYRTTASSSTTDRLYYRVCVGKNDLGDLGDTTDPTRVDCRTADSEIVGDGSLTLQWEYGPLGQTRTRTLTTGTTYVSFRYDTSEAVTRRDVEVVFTGEKAAGGRISDLDTAYICGVSGDGANDPGKLPGWCLGSGKTDTTSDITVTVQGEFGPVADGSQVTNTVRINNVGQYDRYSVDWTASGILATQRGSGDRFTWTATNDYQYAVGIEVRAEATAEVDGGKTSTDSGVRTVDICPDGTTIQGDQCKDEQGSDSGDNTDPRDGDGGNGDTPGGCDPGSGFCGPGSEPPSQDPGTGNGPGESGGDGNNGRSDNPYEGEI